MTRTQMPRALQAQSKRESAMARFGTGDMCKVRNTTTGLRVRQIERGADRPREPPELQRCPRARRQRREGCQQRGAR
eukprot:1970765-Lingulodinium_polyedra.AAC.1